MGYEKKMFKIIAITTEANGSLCLAVLYMLTENPSLKNSLEQLLTTGELAASDLEHDYITSLLY